MPKPSFPIRTIKKDELIVVADIEAALAEQPTATLLLLPIDAAENEGGYFFPVRKTIGNEFDLCHLTKGHAVRRFTASGLADYMNHVSGRTYSKQLAYIFEEIQADLDRVEKKRSKPLTDDQSVDDNASQ
ncbi:hypothetical protein [Burkholderia cepacia]|uniref:hypothetical protein n=1 Tax=Burkholderia cepacia TaxID=292 RepID=UPI000F600431|nr:hypothetical protein [Burkholderia cepacia]MDN7636760.1 hypothetical protein [Burkholderia cepacia]